ncbi:MAG: hypothetical protein QM664_05440 [Flavihumibacter sp.]
MIVARSQTNAETEAIAGLVTNSSPGMMSSGIYGSVTNAGTSSGYGVQGTHLGYGVGVMGFAENGIGIQASSENSTGLSAYSSKYYALDALSSDYTAVNIETMSSDVDGYPAMRVKSENTSAVLATSTQGYGVEASSGSMSAAAVFANNTGNGEAVRGSTTGDGVPAVHGYNQAPGNPIGGRNDGIGVQGTSDEGVGVMAYVRNGGSGHGTALIAKLDVAGDADLAEFKVGFSNVARITSTGEGRFNGGYVAGGADLAEHFAVDGSLRSYEPGDVLEISTSDDRTVVKSSKPYSTLVAGVYATKPGMLLTERHVNEDLSESGVPMGVIGVIPTKVTVEGGIIKRGDLLVTSSTPGAAMKADPDKVKVGQVIGKALADFNGTGTGLIKVLVSVK